MIEMRCEQHMHFQFDPDTMMAVVKCRWCSSSRKRAIFHKWPLIEIIERYNRGEVVGTCAPTDAQFVHWIVKTAV